MNIDEHPDEPGMHHIPKSKTAQYLADHYDGLVNADIIYIDGVKRNPDRVKSILKSYARAISSLTDHTTILKELENTGAGIDI